MDNIKPNKIRILTLQKLISQNMRGSMEMTVMFQEQMEMGSYPLSFFNL